jgi:glutamyl-tRNA reductase
MRRTPTTVVLVSLSASHHDLDLAALERLTVGADGVASDVVGAGRPVLGAVVLATCNRFEVYLDVADPEELSTAVDRVIGTVATASAADEEEARGALRLRTGEQVPRHLFAVAAGLDSMVVGEREIAGQVRRAATRARDESTTTSDLERLFAGAARASRTVDAHAGLGALGRSVVGVALDLVEEGLPAWDEVRALLVGTGSYAGASLAALRARGCRRVSVFSASGRADVFALARDVTPVGEGGLRGALAGVDLVVSCSGSSTPVLDADLLDGARAARDRAARPMVVVDLSLQGDVDPAVGDLPGVRLVDLRTVRDNAPEVREEQVARARTVVERAAEEFEDSLAERAIDHAVVALRDHVHAAVEAEIARLPAGDVPAAQVERAMRRLAATLLHTPSVRARDAARAGLVDEYLTALRVLHGIEP